MPPPVLLSCMPGTMCIHMLLVHAGINVSVGTDTQVA